MRRNFHLLAIFSSLLIITACGGGGGGSSSIDSYDTTVTKLLSSELADESNWTAYETFDQLEDADTVAASYTPAATVKTLSNSLNREKVVTYTANGLVSEFFEYLVSNSEGIAMGSRNYGVSAMKFTDMDSPKGTVYNFRKEFLEGIAEYEDKFYAWFLDGSIVDIATGEIVYVDAPQGTSFIYSAIPKNRFVIDNGRLSTRTYQMNIQPVSP